MARWLDVEPGVTSARAATLRPDLASAVLFGGLAVLGASVVSGRGAMTVAPLLALGAIAVAWHRQLVQWNALIMGLIAVILFVPIGRYTLPANLPFELELYRVAVLVLLAGWGASLLVDDRVRLRRSPLDRPIAVLVGATFASVVVNVGRVIPLQAAVLKSVTFFLSFVLVFYFLVSVIRGQRMVDTVVKVLVAGTTAVAVGAIIEQRTSYNVFDHIASVFPVLTFLGPVDDERFGLVRAVASAQHPIALGVLFAMVLPISVGLAFATRRRRWYISPVLLMIGALATVSRTPILVLAVGGLVMIWYRPREISRLLPALVPMVVVIKLLLPGSLATVKSAFFPAEGLVSEQTALPTGGDPLLAGGRVRQLGPSLREAARTPLVGQGFGTRQTGFDNPLRNAPILDNQWLGLLLEIGLIGAVAWASMVISAFTQLKRIAKSRDGPSGWFATGLAASLSGFAVGMFTYDSLAFVQVAFMFWILLALAACLILSVRSEEAATRFAESWAGRPDSSVNQMPVS